MHDTRLFCERNNFRHDRSERSLLRHHACRFLILSVGHGANHGASNKATLWPLSQWRLLAEAKWWKSAILTSPPKWCIKVCAGDSGRRWRKQRWSLSGDSDGHFPIYFTKIDANCFEFQYGWHFGRVLEPALHIVVNQLWLWPLLYPIFYIVTK
jgi:hypothetical protein